MREFLELFWGGTTNGTLCAGEKKADGGMHQHFFHTIDEAVSFFQKRITNGEHLFFAPAVFKSDVRKKDNALCAKAFWLDIDCGDGKPYQSREDGVNALNAFLTDAHLPQPTIVASGRGLHVYWVLKDPLDPVQWESMATGLKSLCVKYGFNADPTRTSDIASLLRPVGTLNYKTTPPIEVSMVKKAEEYSVDELKSITMQEVAKGTDMDVNVGIIAPDYPDAEASLVLKQCPAMAYVAEKGGAVSEPLWRAFLSIMYRCTNGAKLCHDYSKGDPRYSFTETQKKAEETKGPYTCGTIQSICPDICSRCPCRGKISSPITLGNHTNGLTPPSISDAGDDTARDTSLREEKPGSTGKVCAVGLYTVTAKGILKKSQDGATGFYITKIPIWVNAVREKVRRVGDDGNSSVELLWTALGGRSSSAILPQAVLYEKRPFVKWLAENNIRAVVNNPELLQDFITQCIIEIMRSNSVERYYETLGWYNDGFVLGRRIVTLAGVNPTAINSSSSVTNIKPKGSKEKWIAATSVYEDPEQWAGAFAVLCGFASPLLAICKYQGAVVSLFGPSGFGKTVAGSMALSIYGDPALLTQAASATLNAIGKQLAAHKNVPYFLDEVSNVPAYKLADFIYDAANGRQKDVLSKDRELRQGEGWCLVPFISSNHAVMEMSNVYIQEAHRRRVLEVPFDAKISGDAAAILANAYQDNYGTVGADYLSEIIKQKDKVRELVDKKLQLPMFAKIPSVNRFGKWTIACALVGGMIAKEMGLIMFDPISVVDRVLQSFTADVKRIVNDKDIAQAVITSFLHENAFAINVWSSNTNGVSLTAARQLFARYDPTEKIYYIQVTKYKTLIRDAGLSVRGLESWHHKVGIELVVARLAENFPNMTCYKIPATALDCSPEEILNHADGLPE